MPKKRCFVLMPFTDEWNLNSFFQDTLEPTLKSLDFVCERADTKKGQNLDRRIIEGIYKADIIIADLTGQNCNVFYELGISHSIPKKTLMITQDERKKLPFDINKYDVMKYDPINFIAPEFFKKMSDISSAEEHNPVTDYKPREEPLLSKFAIKCIKDLHKAHPLTVIFIDLDGTLFDSYEHRTRASRKAFQKIFKGKKENDLQTWYEKIYLDHEIYNEIVGLNFRYNWCTEDIYRIAYLKFDKKKDPKNHHEYLTFCKDMINAEDLRNIEDAYDFFMNEPFSPFNYVHQFLEGLKELGFKLILVTEGDKKVQTWKLEQLGLDMFFDNMYIGNPYENLEKLRNHINIKRNVDYFAALELIYEKYKEMHDKYKDVFHADTLNKVLKKFKSVNLAVIGDRYDVDLKPYERINKKNILQIAITQGSKYAEKTEADIKKLKKGESKGITQPHIVKDLAEAFELLVDLDTWEGLKPITSVPAISTPTRNHEEIEQVKQARDKILQIDPADSFIQYATQILNYYGGN